MKKNVLLVLILFLVLPVTLLLGFGQDKPETKDVAVDEEGGASQLIVWTSGDREVALKMVLMYTYNCQKRKWMDKVRLLVWGASAKLLSVDQELQEKIKKIKEAGVELWACKACADLYGVSKKLEELGIKVYYLGDQLADMQKKGWHVLTF
ncbi:MAG: DsrE family protein [Candidatus Aminicenantes bacterium]|nr:MAG: DsrE family protein [Candidatus Aminicenantes bacterium]